MANLQEKIDECTQGIDIEDVDELQLDQIDLNGMLSVNQKQQLEKYKNVGFLTFNDCKLTSLQNFPNFANLQRLELIDNHLKSESLKELTRFKELQFLFLGGKDNMIQKVEDLAPLKELEHLYHLDISNTELSQSENYIKSVFEYLPSLEIVDSTDREGNIVEMDEDDDDDDDEDEDDEGEEGSSFDEDEDEEDEEYDEEEEQEEQQEEEKHKGKKGKRQYQDYNNDDDDDDDDHEDNQLTRKKKQ